MKKIRENIIEGTQQNNVHEFENNIIKHNVENNLEYIQFKRLLEYSEIKHAYILKNFNRNFRVGKDFRNIQSVKKNLEEVSKLIDIDYESIVRPDFDHTNHVEIISNIDKNELPNLRGINFSKTDGLVTDKENITLMATNADCNLILIYDPIKKVIANIHARLERNICQNCFKCNKKNERSF